MTMKKRMHMRSGFAMTLLLALILPILAACGNPQQSGSQPANATSSETSAGATAAPSSASGTGQVVAGTSPNLRIAQVTWPDTLAPQKSSFSNEIAVLLLNYEGLTRFDKDLKTVPAAAESWTYNGDATAITFKLRDGLTYSDGSPLTAQDFVNAVYRTLDPHNPGDYQTSLDMIKGADAIINTAVPTDEAKLPERFKALGVTAPDDKTITFTLAKPTPYFHTLAALWVMYPAKQNLIDKGGEQWYEDPADQIGNGPFQLTKIDHSSNEIAFKANPHYWRGVPKIGGVELKYITDLSVALQAYQKNEVDIVFPDPNDVPTIKANAALSPEYKEYPGSCTTALAFNLTRPPFDNKQVREAFAYGFDREAYVRDALKQTEVATLTWIPTGYPGHDSGESRYGFDPAKAKAALAAAGFPNGQGLPEIKYSYNSNNPANQARAEYLAQMYQKSLDVMITLDPVEGTMLTNLRKSVETYPQMTFAGWCADYPDPQNWLSVYWASTTNFAANVGYGNKEVDTLLAQADVETDEAKRAQLYDQAQKKIIGDAAQIMRSNRLNTYLIKPSVSGLEFTPQDSSYPGQMTSLFDVVIQK